MIQCSYCAMAAENVDPTFAPAAPSLDDDETCDCGLHAIEERSMVRTERSLAWKLRRDDGELAGQAEHDADLRDTIEAAWRPA